MSVHSPGTAPRDSRKPLALGVLGSIAVHLLPFALLLSWNTAPAEDAAPVPVQLVFEEPPAPRIPAPQAKPPRPTRLASVDTGETGREPAPVPETAPAPADMPADAALPSDQPSPPPKLVSALPRPVPEPEPLAAPDPVPAAPAAEPTRPAAKQPVAARLAPKPRPPARVPGPEATRDEYLAYCEMLIRRRLDMLPPSFLAGRSGKAVLSLLVLADGTIGGVAIRQSSGYRDIDVQAQQMLVAVRRFPPLPQWFQGDSMPVNFHLVFREGAVR